MKKALLLAIPLLLAVFAVPIECGASTEWWVVIVGGVELWQYQTLFDSYVCHFTMVQHYNINPDTNIKYLFEYPSLAVEVGSVDNGTTKQNAKGVRKWKR